MALTGAFYFGVNETFFAISNWQSNWRGDHLHTQYCPPLEVYIQKELRIDYNCWVHIISAKFRLWCV